MGGKTWNKECINEGPTEWWGAGLDKDLFNMNENYINYIQSNPKLVLSVEDTSVADTGTTENCLTLNSPCTNKRKAIHPLPMQMPNEEIIKSTHTALLIHQDLPLQARQENIFQGSRRPCCPLGHYASMVVSPPSTTSHSTSITSGVKRPSWGEHETRALTFTCWVWSSKIT